VFWGDAGDDDSGTNEAYDLGRNRDVESSRKDGYENRGRETGRVVSWEEVWAPLGTRSRRIVMASKYRDRCGMARREKRRIGR
jgi:hypothetical protein